MFNQYQSSRWYLFLIAPLLLTLLPTASLQSTPVYARPVAQETPTVQNATSTRADAPAATPTANQLSSVTPTARATATSTPTVEQEEANALFRIFPQLREAATLVQFAGSTPAPEGIAIADLRPRGEAVPVAQSWASTDNYLIIGTDRRPDWTGWNTDVLIVVGIDRPNRKVAMLSLPRDLYVFTPGRGWGRINTVDYVGEKVLKVEGGGPALLSHVVGNTFGIPIQHWVRIEMFGFRDIVDAVGGVTVYLDCPLYEPVLNLNTGRWDYFTLPPGANLLDGEDAYWFVRLRRNESDFGRSRRQRQLLWGLRNKAMETNLITRLPQLWTALSQNFSTDLSMLEMIDLAGFALPLNPSRVRATSLKYGEIQPWTSPYGGAVLRIADPTLLRERVETAWDAPALADTSAKDEKSGECKRPPPGAPVYPAPTPAP